jgi:hypothetical protein
MAWLCLTYVPPCASVFELVENYQCALLTV